MRVALEAIIAAVEITSDELIIGQITCDRNIHKIFKKITPSTKK